MSGKNAQYMGLTNLDLFMLEGYRNNHKEAILELHESLKEDDSDIFLMVVQDILIAFDGNLPEEIYNETMNLYTTLAHNADARAPMMLKLFNAFHLQIPSQLAEALKKIKATS